MTPIPLDRTPFPLANNIDVPLYFTAEPGGSYVHSRGYMGARIVYPNHTVQPPGARFNFWHYRPGLPGWYIYGQATVTPDGKQVVPDPGVSVYEFTGAMFGGPNPGGLGPKIGLAIALRAARDGANIAIAAKNDQPHPKLPGTIHTAAADIEAAGGKALPMQVDIRDEDAVAAAAKRCAEHFGGIEILVNNASAISLTGTLATPAKRFDLMFGVNVRGTFVCSQACIPYLRQAAQAGRNPHILNLSPPLSMKAHWFAPHVAYTMAKYGMSMCVLGMAEEFRPDGIAVNALWPRTVIATAALKVIPLREIFF